MSPIVARQRPRAALGALSAAVAIVVLAGCGSGTAASGSSSPSTAAGGDPSGAASIAGQTITLYNGQHEETTNALVAAFEKQTGVQVKVRSDDEDVLAQQIEQEGTNSPADAFYTENTPPLVRLDEKGLLSPVDPATMSAVPAQYSAGDHNWIGVSARVSVMVYNTTDLQPNQLPKSVLDLADPKWKNKLDIAPGETDFQPIVTSVAADKGDAAAVRWLQALKANAGAHQDPDNETLVANVNKGVTQIGVINHYYWYRLKDEVGPSGLHSALARFAPGDDGYLLDVSGAGVIKSSQHQAAAQALVKFLVSNAGEKVLAGGDSWEYPIGSGVTNPNLPPLSDDRPKQFDLNQIGDGNKAVMLLQQAGLL
ncbi:MAG TPA: extracellular solute-binding protein [Pseudonocardiaceae bacterium]|nr:extracellular solute-binding protein [Pseudonocardiaceae bacterium]